MARAKLTAAWMSAHVHRLHDQRRMLVERRIEDAPRVVVAAVTGQQQLAMQLRGEILDVLAAQRDLATVARDCSNVRDVAFLPPTIVMGALFSHLSASEQQRQGSVSVGQSA